MDLLIGGLLIAFVILTALAGLGVGAPRLQLGWFGLTAAGLALLLGAWPGA